MGSEGTQHSGGKFFYKEKRVSLKKYSLLAMGMGLLRTEVAKLDFEMTVLL